MIHGTKAFLPALINSGNGHLINISSIDGIVAQPDVSSYCTSKFAVRGFTESVTAELIAAGAPVRVTVVHPGGVSTNIATAALERTRKDGTPITADHQKKVDVYNSTLLRMDPAKAARIILDGAAAGKSRVMVGNDARLLDLVSRLVPKRMPALAVWAERWMFGAPPAPSTAGPRNAGRNAFS